MLESRRTTFAARVSVGRAAAGKFGKVVRSCLVGQPSQRVSRSAAQRPENFEASVPMSRRTSFGSACLVGSLAALPPPRAADIFLRVLFVFIASLDAPGLYKHVAMSS